MPRRVTLAPLSWTREKETDAYITIIVVLKITDLILREKWNVKSVCVRVFEILLCCVLSGVRWRRRMRRGCCQIGPQPK